MTLLGFLIVVIVIIWLYKLISRPARLKYLGNQIPGPKEWPLIRNSLLFLKEGHLLRTTLNLCKTYGPVSRAWVGNQLFLFLCDPKDVEVFLKSQTYINKSDSYRLLDSWLGTKNLLTGNADVWRIHRKLLTSSFHFKILETYVEMMRKNASILCDQLESRVDNGEFDILPYVETCSLDIICETAMGVQLETQTSTNSAYLRSIKKVQTLIVKRIFQLWLQSDLLFNYVFGYGKEYHSELNVMKETVTKVIEERKQKLKEQSSTDDNEGDGRKQVKPFLDSMLLQSGFTDEEIENEVQTFMFAGHDTTMTTIAFCMYALSHHPDIQENIYREIQTHLDKGKPEFTYQDYNELKYLENVIKETLRMYTTVPIISRKITEDILLPSGYTVPAGSLANLMLHYMHNNEKYFPNPQQFIPERFENIENITNFTFVPFSAGLRNCIGQKFAMLEMKIVIAALIQKYRFLPSQTVQSLTLETGIVLRSLEKHPLRITFRNVM